MIVAEDRQGAQHFDARCFHRHQDHGLLTVPVRLRIGLAHENQYLAARIAGAGSPPLASVDQVAVAVAHDGGLVCWWRAARCHIGFGHRKCRADLAVEQRREPALLLLLGGIAGQHFHVAGVRRRAIEDFGRDMRAPHDFAQRRVFHIGEAGAVFGMRQKQVPQICRLGLFLQVLDHFAHLPRIAGAAVCFQLLVMERLGGIDMGVHELSEPLL